MRIQYRSSGGALNTSPQYNGNISHVLWQVNNGAAEDTRAYRYNYDQIDRLTNAHYAQRGNGDYTIDAGRYSVPEVTYDLNGNIQTLQRNGGTNLVIDDLTYAYNGNQLKSVSDAGTTDGFTNGASSTDEYGYDANGNLIRDDNKGITGITYNHLNLPEVITLSGGTITFQYDANGNKLRKTVSGVSQDYLGGIEYTNGSIDAIYHEEGRATPSGTSWQYEYYLKDHLGNTRVIFTDSDNNGEPEIIQEADFYPFGMRHDRSVTATNHYLYNGKELNADLGLDWYDYGFRWYDAELGRFPSVDPMAENRLGMTPFNYVSNNPISRIDPYGLTDFYYNSVEGDNPMVYLGTDGVSNGIIAVVTDQAVINQILSNKSKTINPAKDSYIELPPYEHRQEIIGIVEGAYYVAEQKGDEGIMYEMGGIGYMDGNDGVVHVRAQDGDEDDYQIDLFEVYERSKNRRTTRKYVDRLNSLPQGHDWRYQSGEIKFSKWKYTWHSHLDREGGITNNWPSNNDKNFASQIPDAVHMVVSRFDKQIYFYDGKVTLNPSTGTYIPIVSVPYQWFRHVKERPKKSR